ncbi:peptidoglycan-binding protein [Candidatus Kaiserbacteria bacterium]|nr:peptidoglycan-binding protein [Candidatus Kaiserbacteria bacterium]
MFFKLQPGDTRYSLVTVLQCVLVAANFGPPKIITGEYDKATMTAVRKLQLKLGITPTGVYDQEAQQGLKALCGVDILKLHNAFYGVSVESMTLAHVQARKKEEKTQPSAR